MPAAKACGSPRAKSPAPAAALPSKPSPSYLKGALPSEPPPEPPPEPSLLSSPIAAATLGDASTPLAKVVRILNNQLQALTTVDVRTDELSARLAALQGPGGAAAADLYGQGRGR